MPRKKQESRNEMIVRMPGPPKPAQIWPQHIQNPNLSLKAKGLYAHLCTMPDNWTVRRKDLEKRFKEGKSAIQSAINELKAEGYLKTSQKRIPNGQWGEKTTHFSEIAAFRIKAKDRLINTQHTYKVVTEEPKTGFSDGVVPRPSPPPEEIIRPQNDTDLQHVRNFQLLDHTQPQTLELPRRR